MPGVAEIVLTVVLSSFGFEDKLLCPSYPGDPPWRSNTCRMCFFLGQKKDRPFLLEPGPGKAAPPQRGS